MQNDKLVEALEPCPLCGMKADLWRAHPDRPARKAWIACTGRCCIMTREYLTNEEAIAAWNRRATLSRSDDGAGEAVSGWIISNGQDDRWRTWKDGYSAWTDNREEATRYARREDAETVHGHDEEAWHVKPYALAHPPAAVAGEGDQSLREIARDLLRAMHDGQERVGYRLDLWNALADALSQPAADAAHPPADALREQLAELIRTRLLGVEPDDQDLQLEDHDWRVILAALSEAPSAGEGK
ncbi:MAG: Lar family restriction alleviation protein [Pseudomonadota bacterium]